MFSTLTAAPGLSLYTLVTAEPRAAAMAYAKHLVREQGVRLSAINYRRAPDGVITVTAPGAVGMRFPTPADNAR
jgi:hypothetical protein